MKEKKLSEPDLDDYEFMLPEPPGDIDPEVLRAVITEAREDAHFDSYGEGDYIVVVPLITTDGNHYGLAAFVNKLNHNKVQMGYLPAPGMCLTTFVDREQHQRQLREVLVG